MTDEELITRLRDLGLNSPDIAADRIKALNQIVSEMHVLVPELRKKVSDTEDKLAKAVELLTEPVKTHSDTEWLAARNEFLDKL